MPQPIVKAVGKAIFFFSQQPAIQLLKLLIYNVNGDKGPSSWIKAHAMVSACHLKPLCQRLKQHLAWDYVGCGQECPQKCRPNRNVAEILLSRYPNLGSLDSAGLNKEFSVIGVEPEIYKTFGSNGDQPVPQTGLAPEDAAHLAQLGVEFGHPDGVWLGMIPWQLIDPSGNNPRTKFNQATINLMSETLKSGNRKYAKLENPLIVVQKFRDGIFRFELKDGERRLRSAKVANVEKIPCLVLPDTDDIEILVGSCLANFCRENLDLWDIARAFTRIMEHMNWNVPEVANRTGLHKVTVYNALKLLKLHAELQTALDAGDIDSGAAGCFNSYELSKQPAMLKECYRRKILIKGKKTNPVKFSRDLKKVARDMGITGKKAVKPYEHVLINASRRNTALLIHEFIQLAALDQEEIAKHKQLTANLLKELATLTGLLSVTRIFLEESIS